MKDFLHLASITDPVERAYQLAKLAHAGQVDRGAKPYIEHVLRVAGGVTSAPEKQVAFLHDVIEDTDLTAADLAALGFPHEIISAVECMTRLDGVPYEEYLAGIKGNPLATAVKRSDLQDNMNLDRIPSPSPKDLARLEKYKKAKAYLEDSSPA